MLILLVDLHEFLGGANLCPTTPHPITKEKVPLTFGHEFSAIVTEVGKGVEGFKSGDRVAVEVRMPTNTINTYHSPRI